MDNKRVYKELVDERVGVGNGLFLQWKSCLCEKYAIKVEYLLREKIFVVVVIDVRVPIFLWD